MSTPKFFGRAAIASAAALACSIGLTLPGTAAASTGGSSTVCDAVGAPSTTQTIGVKGVFHVTAFTCGDAQATGFQQCKNQTVAQPGVVHATAYYCLPLQFTASSNGVGQTVTIGGVGGISAVAGA